jgi:hypothetical protein
MQRDTLAQIIYRFNICLPACACRSGEKALGDDALLVIRVAPVILSLEFQYEGKNMAGSGLTNIQRVRT